MLAVLLGFLGLILGAAGEEVGWLVGALAGAALGVSLKAQRYARAAATDLGEAKAEVTRLTLELNALRAVPPARSVAQPIDDSGTASVAPGPGARKVPFAPDDKGASGQRTQDSLGPTAQRSATETPQSAATESTSTPQASTASPPPRMSHGVEAPAFARVGSSAAAPVPTVGSTDSSTSSASTAGQATSTFDAKEEARAAVADVPPSAPRFNPLNVAYEWLFGGNTVVRVGLLVLMVGVVLLLKWAADNELFPIEARLILAALIGIALLVVGYRARESKPGFGLTLQGGGIAALYLTTFFAYRFYALIPSGFAFSVLAALGLFTCVLSLLQNTQSLALIGLLGGYLAPISASSGSGSHVGLFAYTALLNGVMLALVFLRGWVNVARLGFLFTFGFLVAWRVLRYEPQHLTTTEPFVVVFFLTYLAVPILLTRRARVEKVNGLGILFGTPLATMGVQAALLHEEPLYMALATVCQGMIYVLVARQMLKRGVLQRELGIAFVAIASGLATVAIPYALQSRGATGAAWAIEGAGIVWFGLRQKQTWTAAAGAFLQLVGLVLYLSSVNVTHDEALLSASVQVWFGAWLQAAALYVTGYLAYRDARKTPLGKALQGALVAASAAFLLGPLAPILDYTQGVDTNAALGVWFSLGCVVLDRAAVALRYDLARVAAFVIVPFVPIFLLACGLEASHAFAAWQGVAWVAVAAALYYVLRCLVSAHLPKLAFLYGVCAWWLCAVVTVELAQLTNSVWDLGDGWVHASVLLAPVTMVYVVLRGVARPRLFRWLGPRQTKEEAETTIATALLFWGTTPIVLGMALFLLAQNAFVSGDVEPLPYVVLANPLDILQILALVAIWRWTRVVRGLELNTTVSEIATGYGYAVFGLAFIWFNAMLARTVHHYADVEFSAQGMFGSDVFQVTVSVMWALLAMTLMWWTSRTARRPIWFVGASLLGATIVKLFLVDLSRLGTGAKILTFLAVGLLVLLIGYLSPVPPSTKPRGGDNEGTKPERGEA